MTGPIDPDALAMGELYKKARRSFVQSVRYALQLGKQLHAKKRSLEHGKWGPWLTASEAVLGFVPRTAQRLIKAYATWTSYVDPDVLLDEATAHEISQFIWGNTGKDTKEPDAVPEQEGSETEVSAPSAAAVVGRPKPQSASARLAAAKKAITSENEPASPQQVRPGVAAPDDETPMEPFSSIWIPQDSSQDLRAQLNSIMDQAQLLDQRIQINRPGLNGRVPL